MNPSLIGILLVALLVVPGFAHYMVTRTIRTSGDDDPAEPVIFLTSLMITACIVSVEIFALGLSAHFSDVVSSRVSELFSDGMSSFGQNHPALVLVLASGTFLGNTALLAVLGTLDPMDWAAQRLLRRKHVKRASAWYMAFRPDEVKVARDAQGATREAPNFAQITLKGDGAPCYRGAIAAYDLSSDKHGERNVVLWNPKRRDSDHWSRTKLTDSLSAVLLKWSEIRSIEVTYDGVPDGIGQLAANARPSSPPHDGHATNALIAGDER